MFEGGLEKKRAKISKETMNWSHVVEGRASLLLGPQHDDHFSCKPSTINQLLLISD